MATYTFDVFVSLDGFGTAVDWPGYWGKEGPELVASRAEAFGSDRILVLGANTYRDFYRIVKSGDDPTFDLINRARKIVLSKTLEPPLKWENTTLVAEDALTAIPRLKAESDLPLWSHGSLSMNRALMAAGLVDRLVITIFPAITGTSGRNPVFVPGAEFDLELLESHTFDGRVQQLVYAPTLHKGPPRDAEKSGPSSMPGNESPALRRFEGEKVVQLQTRKRDGTWVDTPVNLVVDHGHAYFRTPAKASKNKRLRNFPNVRIRPCTWSGKPTGPPAQATAHLLAGEEYHLAGALIDEKFPVVQRVGVHLAHRLMRTSALHYELTDVTDM